MDIKIESISTIPFNGFTALKRESQLEGFYFLERLEADWTSNKNVFNKEGEGLRMIKVNNQIAGLGGINNNSYGAVALRMGRLRRFFISKPFRRKGIGTALLNHLIQEYGHHYDAIQLYTDNAEASFFYEKYGFQKVHHIEKATHLLRMMNNKP